MKINISQIIETINNANTWIDANELGALFNVSTRTIRNYIKRINETHSDLILGSNKGYKINKSKYSEYNRFSQTPEDNINQERIQYVINQLLVAKDSVDIYELADELAISDAHFERLITRIKEYLSPFHVSIERKRNKIRLAGSELNKRKIINKLLSTYDEQFVYFTDPFNSEIKFEIGNIKNDLVYILENFGFYINDYGLNTILLHIIVLIERISSGNVMDSRENMRSFSVKEQNMLTEIKKYIQTNYRVELQEDDLYWLAMVILNNCAHTGDILLNHDNINLYVEEEYLVLSKDILSSLSKNYGLESFTSDFAVNFTIHIRNLVKRAENQSYTINPLTNTFKGNYPLIYDMATYATKVISDRTGLKINDDEISFIAFHIGSYLENSNMKKSKVNCCFVYAEYHNFHVKSVEKIIQHLHSELYISSTISIKSIEQIPPNVELLISCCSIPKNITSIPIIETTMFISNDDISNIRDSIKIIKEKKKKEIIVSSLQQFIEKKLFRKNFYLDTYQEIIHYLANECLDLGLVNENYESEVLEREELSSTSFSNGVAIPHSLNMSANHSFLSVIINSKPMKWGENNVNIVIMIGTSMIDRDAFKFIFDELIMILYDEENVRRLVKCGSYEEFTEEIASMILGTSHHKI